VLRFRYAKKLPRFGMQYLVLQVYKAPSISRTLSTALFSQTRKITPQESAGDIMPLSKRAAAEFFGTFWLVFGGCGSAVLAAGVHLGIGYVGVAFAFGLTVLTMAFAIGHVSGCHLNPAVSIGLVTAKRFPISELPAYIVAQVLGAIAASGVLYVIASGNSTFSLAGGFASNGYADHSPEHYSLLACFLIEVLLTAFFLLVILGATDERAPKGFAPIAIGLCLTLIHLISIPVTNTSVNPARSTGPAIFVGGWALGQLWLFWVAPILGAIIGGLISTAFFAAPQQPLREEMSAKP
jgi:aquaporin Z